MKKTLQKVGVVLLISAVLFGVLMYATSAETWYAGMHIAGCDGSQDCGCYKKLLEMDKANIQNSKSSKR